MCHEDRVRACACAFLECNVRRKRAELSIPMMTQDEYPMLGGSSVILNCVDVLIESVVRPMTNLNE